MNIYLGEKYIQSAAIFVVYNLIVFVRINDYQDIIIAKGKTKIIWNTTLICTTSNIVLNYILIKYFGAIGAAFSTVLSISLLAVILSLRTKSLIKLNSLNDIFGFVILFKIILISILINIMLSLIFTQVNLFNFILKYCTFLALTYTLLYRIGLIDKAIVRVLFQKIIAKFN